MQTTETFSLEGALRSVAGFGLPDVPERDAIRVPEKEWPSFLPRLGAEHLSGLAVATWQTGGLALEEQQAEDLLARHREDMAWVVGLERTLLDLADAFDREGIEFVVLKGSTLAHMVYPDPSWRPFGDLDLLVRTRDWRRTLALLARLGYRRRLPEPRKGFDERFGKAATHLNHQGQELDLHRTLVLGPFGLWVNPEELIDRAEWFEVGDRKLRRLDVTGTFIEVCVHAALGSRRPSMLSVRDVAQCLAGGSIDWDAVNRWADKWRLGPVIRHALATASQRLGTSWPLKSRYAARPATRGERRVLEAYTVRRSRGGTAVATLHAVRGLRGKAAYLRALILPERVFSRQRRGHGGTALFGRWRTAAGWLTGRKG